MVKPKETSSVFLLRDSNELEEQMVQLEMKTLTLGVAPRSDSTLSPSTSVTNLKGNDRFYAGNFEHRVTKRHEIKISCYLVLIL